MKLRNKNQTGRKSRPSVSRRPRLSTYYRGEPGPSAVSPFESSPVRRSARRFFFGFLDIIFLMVITAAIIYSLLIKPSPKLIISSTAYHSAADYQAAADQVFSSIGNRNKLTFNQNQVAQSLKKQFPEISVVSTELPFFSQIPTVRLGISQPILRLINDNRTYIVDSDGIVAAESAGLDRGSSLPTVIDQSGFNAALGKPALSSSDVRFIKLLDAELKRSKIPVASMSLPAAAQELDLRVIGQSYFVKFFLDGDVLRQTGQYLAARSNFAKNGSPPAVYLDVRVPGKIFYK